MVLLIEKRFFPGYIAAYNTILFLYKKNNTIIIKHNYSYEAFVHALKNNFCKTTNVPSTHENKMQQDMENRLMDMVGGEERQVWREQHGNLHYHM